MPWTLYCQCECQCEGEQVTSKEEPSLDSLKLLRDNISPKMVASILADVFLTQALEKGECDPDDGDLNPHLQVKFICDAVSKKMSEHPVGVEYSSEDVMLYWLTMTLWGPAPELRHPKFKIDIESHYDNPQNCKYCLIGLCRSFGSGVSQP